MSINKKPGFVLKVVTFENIAQSDSATASEAGGAGSDIENCNLHIFQRYFLIDSANCSGVPSYKNR